MTIQKTTCLVIILGMAIFNCTSSNLYKRASIYSEKGEYESAILTLKEALIQDTGSVPYCLLIKAFSDFNKSDSAMKYLKLAQSKYPNDYLVHKYAGLFYLYDQHVFDSSRYYFTKALDHFIDGKLELVFPQKIAELEDLRGLAIMNTWDSSSCSLLNGYLTFKKPAEWSIQRLNESIEDSKVQFIIPMKSTNNTRHSANSRVGIYTEADTVTLQSKVNYLKKVNPNDFNLIYEISDTPSSVTIVWTAKDQHNYICINMYTLKEKKSLEVMIAFPLMKKEDENIWKLIVEDYNELIKSMKLNGSGFSISALKYAQIQKDIQGLSK